jgi:hypothetical protein
MRQVEITTHGNNLVVVSPYNPNFPAAAKLLGGKWDADRKAWVFDARDEARVRALCQETYGEGGEEGADLDLVTVRLRATSNLSKWHEGLFCCGRKVAAAIGKTSGAKLGDGVVVLAGKLGSGGSHANWTTTADAGTEVEIKDVPRAATENVGSDWEIVEIITQEVSSKSGREELVEERARLKARIAEIERMLNQ